jgi:hypothetical protein
MFSAEQPPTALFPVQRRQKPKSYYQDQLQSLMARWATQDYEIGASVALQIGRVCRMMGQILLIWKAGSMCQFPS